MQSYDNKKPCEYITYLDIYNAQLYNELMSWAIYIGFKWLNHIEIYKFCLNLIEENSSIGYILKVDLEYPDKIQELHNDYLLATEMLEISHNMLPDYCSNISNEYGIVLNLYKQK